MRSGSEKNFSWLFGIQQKGGKIIMIEPTTSQDTHKKGLQRQIRQTSDSLRDTVEQIQDTAEQKYQAVKKTVSDVLDYREEFQKEPVVWTVGALSAGFAAGYAVGYSHKLAQNKKGSQFATFADTVVNDLSRLGQRFVLPELNAKITELFGFYFRLLAANWWNRQADRNKTFAWAAKPEATKTKTKEEIVVGD
jgi:hypothetical protein